MTDLHEADDHATPITPAERAGLIPTHITLKSELNELEQRNIARADRWAFSRRRDVLDERFLRGLHRRMFYEVWEWAGDYRTTERNLGVKPFEIEPGMRQAIDDARYWVEHGSYVPDELAVRLHHKLVSVHPFPNGNGRWSRMAGDLMIVRLGDQRFSWGGGGNLQTGPLRKTYIEAVQAADDHDFGPLLAFARS